MEFLYVIISLFGIFIIPFKGVFSSYFKKLYISPNIKNLLFNKGFLLLSLFILFGYLISFSPLFLLIVLSYLFLTSFKIDENKLFLAGISLFIVFLFLYFIGSNTYNIYLIYSFYLFISGIVYYSINTFVNIDNFFKKNGDTIIKYSLTISFLIFITCLYFIKIFFLLPYLVLINLITLNLLGNYKIDIKSTNDFFKNDFTILGLFIIIFVPLINDFFQIQEKTNILFLAFLGFFLIYIGLNLKINKPDINNFLNLKVTRKDAKSNKGILGFNIYCNDKLIYSTLLLLLLALLFIFILLFIFGINLLVDPLIIFCYLITFIFYITYKLHGFTNKNNELKVSDNNIFIIALVVLFTISIFSGYSILKLLTLDDYKEIYIVSFSLLIILAYTKFLFDGKLGFDFIKPNKITSKGEKNNDSIFVRMIPIIKIDSSSKKNYLSIYKFITILILITFVYIKHIYFNQTIDNQIQDKLINTTADIKTIDDIQTDDDINIENTKLQKNDVIIETQNIVKKVKIGEIYKFNNYLSYGNESEDTKKLQEFLTKLGYFKGEINGKFGNDTMFALKNTLIYECNWPKTNKGVLGTQAAACIEILEIEVND